MIQGAGMYMLRKLNKIVGNSKKQETHKVNFKVQYRFDLKVFLPLPIVKTPADLKELR